MTSIFEIETIISNWEPPFKKDTTTKVFNVKKGELFDMSEQLKEDIFMLKEEFGDSVVIEFDRRFVLKNGVFSANRNVVGPQTIRLFQGRSVELSFMWGTLGVTKKITFQGINGKVNEVVNQATPQEERSEEQEEAPEEPVEKVTEEPSEKPVEPDSDNEETSEDEESKEE